MLSIDDWVYFYIFEGRLVFRRHLPFILERATAAFGHEALVHQPLQLGRLIFRE